MLLMQTLGAFIRSFVVGVKTGQACIKPFLCGKYEAAVLSEALVNCDAACGGRGGRGG